MFPKEGDVEIHKYDVVIIGAGTAGSNAARAAQKTGAKVALVHLPGFWNTCVWCGCMPSKSILAGVRLGEDLWEIESMRDLHILRLHEALVSKLESDEYKIFEGKASFLSNDEGIEVVQNHEEPFVLKGRRYVLAVGAKAFIPQIEGLEEVGYWTSGDIVSLEAPLKNPGSLLILGGGPIGLEMGAFFRQLGSEVTIIHRGKLLPTFDPEFGEERIRIANKGKKRLESLIFEDAKVQSVFRTSEGISAHIAFGGSNHSSLQLNVSQLLVATGVRPNFDGLCLDRVGITLENGRLKHSEHLQTDNPQVYVAGDANGHHQILHIAAEEGKVAGHNAGVGEPKRKMQYDSLSMGIIFDSYPAAQIGLTEREAHERDIDVVCASQCFNSIGMGILTRQEYGLWKVVVERKSGRILGAQILGPPSTPDLIHLFAPILYNKNTASQVLEMTWYHPTFAEILKSLVNQICKKDKTICPGVS